jgi:hypothetical protein
VTVKETGVEKELKSEAETRTGMWKDEIMSRAVQVRTNSGH